MAMGQRNRLLIRLMVCAPPSLPVHKEETPINIHIFSCILKPLQHIIVLPTHIMICEKGYETKSKTQAMSVTYVWRKRVFGNSSRQ